MRTPLRRLLGGAARCLAVLALIAAPATARTRVVETGAVNSAYLPLAGLHVVNGGSAENCSGGSDAVGNAYRCFAGNGVFDPCWNDASNPAEPAVLCRFKPWSKQITRLTVAQGGLPAFFTPALQIATYQPWGVELSGGDRCVAAQGAHDGFRGHVVNYYCSRKDGKPAKRVLVDKYRNRHGSWRFRSARIFHHGDRFIYRLGGWRRAGTVWYAMQDRSNEIAAAANSCSVGALAFAGMAFEEANNEPHGPMPTIISHACDSGYAIAVFTEQLGPNESEASTAFKATPTGWSVLGSSDYIATGAFGIPEDVRARMVAAIQGNPNFESVYF